MGDPMKPFAFLLLALGAVGLALPAAAADDTDYCVDYDSFYDDGYFEDEVIDEAEYAEIGDVWFDAWDVDDSGYLGEDEFTTCYDAIGWDPGDSFARWDADDDQLLDEEEFLLEDSYDAWDADESDEVEATEWF